MSKIVGQLDKSTMMMQDENIVASLCKRCFDSMNKQCINKDEQICETLSYLKIVLPFAVVDRGLKISHSHFHFSLL